MENETKYTEVGFRKRKITDGLFLIHIFYSDKSERNVNYTYAHQQPDGRWIYVYWQESSLSMLGDEGIYDTLDECIEAYESEVDCWEN